MTWKRIHHIYVYIGAQSHLSRSSILLQADKAQGAMEASKLLPSIVKPLAVEIKTAVCAMDGGIDC